MQKLILTASFYFRFLFAFIVLICSMCQINVLISNLSFFGVSLTYCGLVTPYDWHIGPGFNALTTLYVHSEKMINFYVLSYSSAQILHGYSWTSF